MKILVLAFFTLQAESASASMTFPTAGIAYFSAVENFRKETEKFLELECLSRTLTSAFDKMIGQVGKAQKKLAGETTAYMSAVSAPMPGTGKCDGGFEAVFGESEKRRQRTLTSLAKWNEEEGQITEFITAAFTAPNMSFDVTNGKSCANEAKEAMNALKKTAQSLRKVADDLNASLQFESTRFADYRDRNKQLQVKCGQLDAGAKLQDLIPPVFSPSETPGFAGKSGNGRSDVTGVQEDLAKKGKAGGDERSGKKKISHDPTTLESRAADPSASDVTSDIIAKLSGYEALMEKSPEGNGPGSKPMGAAPSAGAAIWDLPKDSSRIANLELKRETKSSSGATSAPAIAAGSLAAKEHGKGAVELEVASGAAKEQSPESGSHFAGAQSRGHSSSESELAPLDLRASAVGPNDLSSPLASTEEDLFAMVHRRYRATDLFRKAKPTTVPLDSFESRIKR